MTEIFVLIEHLRGQVSDISHTMLAAAKASNAKTVALLLGDGAEGLADELDADQVIYMEHAQLSEYNPSTYLQALDHILAERKPALLLLGHTTIGMDLANHLALKHGWPLVSQVYKLVSSDKGLGFISQICGGKLLAEGTFGSPTSVASMVQGGYKPEGQKPSPSVERMDAPEFQPGSIKLVEYIEPEAGDIDISQIDILVAVGRGIGREDDLELAEELAQALGGAVCASRPVVDQGWLSTSRLVGKSGHSVKPRLYLAFGISGAPEHMEGVTDSGAIIAVNTDPAAPIFKYANYGVQIDALDLLPVLTEKITAAKGG
ncbi:MAG: electron transfer flavoprotein subunit alpha/FixB family protein [Anaerolineales bacterium]|jgi:electron transfer flavoprotein alpha subunit